MAKKNIATFLAPSKGLSITGSHCYAFSGTLDSLDSEQTVFNFTTGSEYIVATLTMTAPIRFTAAQIDEGRTRGYRLKFNGQIVGLYKVDSVQEDMPSDTEVQILIPPITAVVLTCIDVSADPNYLGTANLTGRVYDA